MPANAIYLAIKVSYPPAAAECMLPYVWGCLRVRFNIIGLEICSIAQSSCAV